MILGKISVIDIVWKTQIVLQHLFETNTELIIFETTPKNINIVPQILLLKETT